jgi:microsomal epoxide hydrolase
VIEPLTNPEKFGGTIDDAFSVVIPSLPGYGFSSKPKAPTGTRTIARLFDKLMTTVLGYQKLHCAGRRLGRGGIKLAWL